MIGSPLATALGDFGEKREIEALDRLAAFERQFGADAAFIFEAGDFMASSAAEMTHPLLAFRFQLRIIHEGSVGIGGWLLVFFCVTDRWRRPARLHR